MQKVFINQGIAVLTEILNELRIKKVLVAGNNAYQSIENLIKPYTKSISIKTFVMTLILNFKTIISGCEELKQSNSDLIIIGGGRIIDAAKLISVTALSKEKNYENVIRGKEL